MGLGVLGAVYWPKVFASAKEEALLLLTAKVELPEVSIGQGFGGARFSIRATGIWAHNTLAAVAAGRLLHLVDFKDPKNPTVTTVEISGEAWDVYLDEKFLYASLNYSPDGTSLLIYDIGNPKAPKLAGILRAPNYAGAHNVFVSGKAAFLASFGAAGTPERGLRPGPRAQLHLADISDPTNPLYLGALEDPEGRFDIRRIHDVTVIGHRAYLAGWETGFWIIDFENLDNPKQLKYKVVGHHAYTSEVGGSPNTHTVWPSQDGKILFTTDEVRGEFVRAWDISDLNNIKLLSQYRVDDFAIPHNLAVDGQFAYVAYYTEGVKVLDFSKPNELKEVASFDTDPRPPNEVFEPFSGAWDVYPFGKFVLVGDTETGLFILEKQGILLGKR